MLARKSSNKARTRWLKARICSNTIFMFEHKHYKPSVIYMSSLFMHGIIICCYILEMLDSNISQSNLTVVYAPFKNKEDDSENSSSIKKVGKLGIALWQIFVLVCLFQRKTFCLKPHYLLVKSEKNFLAVQEEVERG